MMGPRQVDQAALFYEFSLERHVPTGHLLRSSTVCRPVRSAAGVGTVLQRAVRAHAIVVATGARHRKLNLPDYDRFEGQGISYAATGMEAQLCEHQEVALVGGDNSAGQAAMFLSRTAAHVHNLVQGAGLAATLSDYLVQRITMSPRITVHPFTQVTAIDGDTFLPSVTWADRRTGTGETRAIGSPIHRFLTRE